MNTRHIVESFDAELQRLTGEIADMRETALNQVGYALQALEQHDDGLAQHVIDGNGPTRAPPAPAPG